MKNLITYALTLAFLASQAGAQPTVTGKIPPLEQLPLRLQLQLDPKLPAYPKLDVSQPARVQIRVLSTYRGPLFQLEVVRKSRADVLESVVAAMGGRCVVEPILSRSYLQIGVFRGLSLEELLVEVTGSSVESWKSAAGVIFFADKPNPVLQKMLDDLVKQREIAPRETYRFSFNAMRPVQPFVPTLPPGAKAFDFNGERVYHVPLHPNSK